MNRFRTRKKIPKDVAPVAGPGAMPAPPEPPQERPMMPPPSKSFRLGRRKQSEPEPEPKLDLSSALPKEDDFRTSLLMPKLSARFSMLRDANDPSSKVGLANDDSVLAPPPGRRTSRFPTGDLDDIAEVSSIRSPAPPFANAERANSFASTDDDGAGGMMSRARPGEGNSLFGGRQKVYRLPTGAVSSSRSPGATGGKPLYDDDVHLSTFQRLRKQNREAAKNLNENFAGSTNPFSMDDEAPLYGYNRNRETSSSTNSGPSNGRTSTAATSVTSQVGSSELERSITKSSRRLYDHGLDQQLHDQQSGAMSRLDQLTRQRQWGATSPTLTHAKSATSLQDRYKRVSPTKSPIPSHRTTPDIPGLRPEDRGKATALGTFNKPRAYDEMQYSERQRQLQQGRATSSSSAESSPPQSASSQRDQLETLPATSYTAPQRRPPTPPQEPRPSVEQNFFNGPSESEMSAEDSSNTKDFLPRVSVSEFDSGAFLDTDSTQTKDVGDSPTLGPTPGLSGMIRQHLRSDSDKSSVYGPPPSPGFQEIKREHSPSFQELRREPSPPRSIPQAEPRVESPARAPPQAPAAAPASPPQTSSESGSSGVPHSPPEPSRHDPRAYRQWKRSRQAETGFHGSFARDQRPSLDKEEPQSTSEQRHHRDASTETQRELDAFSSDIAERRRMVQENLRSFAEEDSRSSSPSRWGSGLGILSKRSGTNRESSGGTGSRPDSSRGSTPQPSQAPQQREVSAHRGMNFRGHVASRVKNFQQQQQDHSGRETSSSQASSLRDRSGSETSTYNSWHIPRSTRFSPRDSPEPETFAPTHPDSNRGQSPLAAAVAAASTSTATSRPSPTPSFSPHLSSGESVLTSGLPTPSSEYDFPSPLPGTGVVGGKRRVLKGDISDPTFLSCTSNVSTTSLAHAAAGGGDGGSGAPPPVPPINPRRRRRTNSPQNDEDATPPHSASGQTPTDYSPRGGPALSLHKARSEGGLNLRRQRQGTGVDSPPVPGQSAGQGARRQEGVLF